MKQASESDTACGESAEMTVVAAQPWQLVLESTSAAQERQETPFLWALDVATALLEARIAVPSLDLGHVMVQHLCSTGGHASLWAYLEYSMASYLVFPVHVIALMTAKVIPLRLQHPEMYSVYLNLTGTHVFSLAATKCYPGADRLVTSVNEVLQLSGSTDVPVKEVGAMLVHFLFTLVGRLADATAEDWSGRSVIQGKLPSQGFHGQGAPCMSMDAGEDFDEKRREERERLKRCNGIGAIDLIAKLMENSRTAALIRLARKNMPEQWNLLTKRLQLLEALSHDISSAAPKEGTEALSRLAGAIQQGLQREWRPTQMPIIRALLETRSSGSYASGYGAVRTPSWLPFDIYMEDAVEGMRLRAASSFEILAELIRSMQAIQCATWHDTFLGLWTAALRLVNRDREILENNGPNSHTDCRLCMLLSLVPLAAGILIEEEEEKALQRLDGGSGSGEEKERKLAGSKRAAFATSLQVLGQMENLLYTHPKTAALANQAAAAAAAFVSSVKSGSGSGSLVENSNVKPVAGNMRHLIVESCIARGLLDTSAYFWPGMTASITNGSNQPSAIPTSPWTLFMEGAALSGSLRSALMSTPAGSLAELEKMYHVAISGPEEDRAAAASIIAGASLLCGWKIQEHAVRYAVRLLSPPNVESRDNTYLISYSPMLLATLAALAPNEVVNILSLYVMYPELAEKLLPICEVFGALPTKPTATNAGEDVSAYSVFSSAFLLLVRLWKFHRPPAEHCLLGCGAPLGAEMNLECLLQLRNSQITASDVTCDDKDKRVGSSLSQSFSSPRSSASNCNGEGPQLVSLESFPKLKAWHEQNGACIAASLSNMVRSNPVHQHVDRLVSMMFKKQVKGANPIPTTSTGVMNSGGDDQSARPVLSAWEVMAATPFIMDAVLTACAHGKLSSRDLITGLKELVDYLPATTASVVSYLSAEITRGLSKMVSMNGNDWPSPAANLSLIESEIQEILTAAGVQIPSQIMVSTSNGGGPASLPLPLAALVSLTITFKQDKSSALVLAVAGNALEYGAGGSPWPSMPVAVALWAQKVPRWHDYIVYVGAKTVFKNSNQAVSQLLRSCFAATLGSSTSTFAKPSGQGGVVPLLGHSSYPHPAPNGRPQIFPGILYLRSYLLIQDITFLSDEILVLVAGAARDLATGAARDLQQVAANPALDPARLRSAVHPSLSTAMAKVTQASALGASLLCVSGGTTLVQSLYLEALPTWFMSPNGFKGLDNGRRLGGGMEGYAIAHFALLSGVLTWGVSAFKGSPTFLNPGTSRKRIVSAHLEFIASALDAKLVIGCEQLYWKAYVIGYLALMVTCAPNWILDVKHDTLKSLAKGLRYWHEHELAVALLERGGSATLSAAAELALGSFPFFK